MGISGILGGVDRLQHAPEWRDTIYVNEYYHGDNAADLIGGLLRERA